MSTAVIISRKKNLMENNDLNRAYLIDISFGMNLKMLSWILVYLLVLCFTQFLTPYLVEFARHNALKNVFTEISPGLPKPTQIDIKYFHNFFCRQISSMQTHWRPRSKISGGTRS